MTVYKRPGVYIQETLTPLAAAAGNTGQATAAFVGTNKQGGPITPTLVTSWSQYVSIFGAFGDTSDYLPFSVYEYFNNGGSGAYIVRAVASDAVPATITLSDSESSPAPTLKITAVSPGTWGDNLYVDIVPSVAGGGRFDLVVYLGGTTAVYVKERFTSISLDPADSRNAQALLNSPIIGSQFIRVQSLLTSAWLPTHAPAAQTGTVLGGGSDGTAAVDLGVATQTLGVLTDNLVVNLPGVSSATVLNPIITWAEAQSNVFLVVDGAKASSTDNAASYALTLEGMATGGSSLTQSSHVAVYGPWLIFNDPATAANGSARLLPPGGAVLGQYARTDASRGVQKPPAGVDTVLKGVIDVQFRFVNGDQDTLNSAGINLIKSLPGTGFVIYGARTLNQGLPDKYISVRRSLMLAEKGVYDRTQFAAFEPNDAILWTQVTDVLNAYLLTLMQTGVLAGSTPAEAYFVICDATNNTASTVPTGVVNITVGLAVQSPAEFIVIQVGQLSATDLTNAS